MEKVDDRSKGKVASNPKANYIKPKNPFVAANEALAPLFALAGAVATFARNINTINREAPSAFLFAGKFLYYTGAVAFSVWVRVIMWGGLLAVIASLVAKVLRISVSDSARDKFLQNYLIPIVAIMAIIISLFDLRDQSLSYENIGSAMRVFGQIIGAYLLFMTYQWYQDRRKAS